MANKTDTEQYIRVQQLHDATTLALRARQQAAENARLKTVIEQQTANHTKEELRILHLYDEAEAENARLRTALLDFRAMSPARFDRDLPMWSEGYNCAVGGISEILKRLDAALEVEQEVSDE